MKLSLKAKTLISVALFLAIFIALLLIATFFDFQISKIMTKGILDEGAYYATDFFGVLLEMVGCIPLYLLIAFAFCVLFWGSLRIVREKNKALSIALAVLCAIGVVAACWYTVNDIMKYIFKHIVSAANIANGNIAEIVGHNFAAIDEYRHGAAQYGVEVVIAALIAIPSLFATKMLHKDAIRKLVRLLIVAGVAILVANVIVHIIKTPIGRMRFRAINSTLGQGLIESGENIGYTPWYVINKQPLDAILKGFEEWYGVDDAFKSFPSGHTCSAGAIYALVILPDLFEFKNKKGAKLACWIVPILYTGIVAISRIMVGAHYMSDVLVGGTLAFACMILSREILLLKGKHFFAVFPPKSSAAAEAAKSHIDACEDAEVNEADRGGEASCDLPQTCQNDSDSATVCEEHVVEPEKIEDNDRRDF